MIRYPDEGEFFSDEIERPPKKKKEYTEPLIIKPVSQDIMNPVEYTISNCNDSKYVEWLTKHAAKDALTNFIIASMVSGFTKKGFVGVIKTSNPQDLINWIKEINSQYHEGKALRIVSSLGNKLFPFPLMELPQGLKWLKENSLAEYLLYESFGMVNPYEIFNYRKEPFLLVATLNHGQFEKYNFKTAKYLLNNVTAKGFTAILIYTDEEDLKFLQEKGLFNGLRLFNLGGY